MLGVAIIGASAVCAIHLDSFLDHSDVCEIRAICDISLEKAQAAIDGKGLSATAYADVEDMLANAETDLVPICLPLNLHCDIAVKSLKAGKLVLVEKPIASSLEECGIMIAVQQESGRLLSVVSCHAQHQLLPGHRWRWRRLQLPRNGCCYGR